MQIQVNSKNFLIFIIVVFFIYLSYVIWGSKDRLPELDVELKDLISYAVLAVQMGGHAVEKIYAENDLNIRRKGNTDVGKAELLTKADLVSNQLIVGLLRRFPLLKVVTEEKSGLLSENEVDKYRDDNYQIWLNIWQALEKFPKEKYNLDRVTMWVDPLDATQEFTEGLTEYVTVMACIVIDKMPLFGVIYKPFSNETILGMAGFGILDSNGNQVKLKPRIDTQKNIVVSRSHAGSVRDVIDKAFKDGQYTVVPAGGSGYKTLQLINGSAELYVHTTAIKKWDVCAGDALARAAGGTLIDFQGRQLDYSLGSDEFHNGGFLMSIHSPYTMLSQIKNFLPNQ